MSLGDERNDSPDWEILKLLREVRRRVRAGNPQRFLDHLEAEPKWVAALPEAEAKVARSMLAATREFARRAVDAAPSEAEVFLEKGDAPEAPAIPPPELAVAAPARRSRAPRVLAVQSVGVEPPRRRRPRAS